ncbi:MAG TPA: choice-of-anchor B family protein [Euzebya sp.]|nr:choice-of-anchor B family protein [Euzebya sp.]
MRSKLYPLLVVAMAVAGLAAADVDLVALTENRVHARLHEQKVADRLLVDAQGIPEAHVSDIPCVDGQAGGFACDGIDLLSFTPLADLGFIATDVLTGGGASDIWGWTSPDTGKEYVLLGHTNGTAAVDVTNPLAPVYLGSVPNTSPAQLIWHDIKIVNDHAVIASESAAHGLQILDLTRLDGMDGSTSDLPITFDAFYPLSGAQHNLVDNEDADQMIVVGGSIAALGLPADQCDSGLNILDFSNPLLPTPAGCYADSSYIHDAQCLTYDGPDIEHVGKNICANFAEDHISIVDITDPAAGTLISRFEYDHTRYTHQGWFTEDRRYLLANDELDETDAPEVTHTRTLVIDVSDLDAPRMHLEAMRDGSDGNPATTSIDHNNYTHGGRAYQSNYTSGLRVIDLAGLDADDAPRWQEVAFFDTYPATDAATFHGTWSNYPYFESGTIAVSGIDEGLFLLRLQDPEPEVQRPGNRPEVPPGHYRRPRGPDRG